jgi:hypothetical protein
VIESPAVACGLDWLPPGERTVFDVLIERSSGWTRIASLRDAFVGRGYSPHSFKTMLCRLRQALDDAGAPWAIQSLGRDTIRIVFRPADD